MKTEDFGTLPDGRKVSRFTLANRRGFEVNITNYGGIVTAICVPDQAGPLVDVALGFDTLAAYLKGHPYFGAITGRVAGRITGGKFTLAGRSYSLAINNPPNHLHGGLVGLDKRLWAAETDAVSGKLRLSYLSPDGEEGYPGNVRIVVEYTVTEKDELCIDYRATTDRPTLLNLTNHTYFNLAGEGRGDIRGHRLAIFADHFTPTDEQLTLAGHAESVDGRANDFREPARIGDRLAGLLLQHGDCYVLRPKERRLQLAARLVEPDSGRVLEVLTTEPCLQFYTGRFLDGSLLGKSGRPYGSHAGLCLECQKFPEALGRPEFDSIELRPGETYRQTTIYRFASEPPAATKS